MEESENPFEGLDEDERQIMERSVPMRVMGSEEPEGLKPLGSPGIVDTRDLRDPTEVGNAVLHGRLW